MSIVPKKLAIYYGWPSLVNGSASIAAAVSHFSSYDMVVFGSGLEDPGHGDHANTVAIITDPGMVNTKVYGYVDATIGFGLFFQKVDQWLAMGVAGVFLDQFGYDFGVSRLKQNALVEYIRYKGMNSFVNAWNPDDVFGAAVSAPHNPLGLTASIDANDWYLAESYQIINGAYQLAADWKTKSDKMVTYKTSFGTKMATVTTNDASPYDQAKFDYAYFSTVEYEFDACGWGELYFSASDNQLPFRTRKAFYGTSFTSALSETAPGVFERNTNVGIHVDTNTHVVDIILN